MNKRHSSPRAVSRRTFLGQLAGGAAAFSIITSSKSRGQPAGTPRKLGVAIVGLGSYARGQIGPALKLTQECELRGIVTGTPTKVPTWQTNYGFPEKNVWNYQTMHQIADAKDIDIVYVITPNSMHAEGVIAAAKAGKHVISEKPFTTNVADAVKAMAACREAKVKLAIGYRMHYDPFAQEMIRIARSKEYGVLNKIDTANGFVMNNRPWRAQHALSGGGPLMDMGVYSLQAACMMVEEKMPIAITAKEHPKTKPQIFQDVEEGIDWTMEWEGGIKANLMSSYQQNVGRFRAEGDKGWVNMEPAFSYRGVKLTTSGGGESKIPAPQSQQAIQLDDFAKCVREGRESRVSGEMGLRDMKIIEAIYASAAKGGERVTIKA